MKKGFSVVGVLVATLLMTGCFESEDSKAIRAALAEEVELGADVSGYEVTDVEVMNETSDVNRGYDIRELGFTAVATPKGDAVLYADRFEKVYFYTVPDKLEPKKFAGRYMVATNGVKTETDLRIDEKTWNNRLRSKSGLEAKYERVLEVGSEEAKAFLKGLAEEKAAWATELGSLEKAQQEVKGKLSALDHWTGTPEEKELQKQVREAREAMRSENRAIKADIETSMNKELTPHHQEHNARLKAARKQHGAFSGEYREFRYKENDRYKKIEQEIIDRYSKQYADKELKTTPRLEAAEKKLADYQAEKKQKIADLRKQSDEKYSAVFDLKSKISSAERLIANLTQA